MSLNTTPLGVGVEAVLLLAETPPFFLLSDENVLYLYIIVYVVFIRLSVYLYIMYSLVNTT